MAVPKAKCVRGIESGSDNQDLLLIFCLLGFIFKVKWLMDGYGKNGSSVLALYRLWVMVVRLCERVKDCRGFDVH